MEYPIIISNINDFIFCPISIYYHQLYADIDKITYYEARQLNGSQAHNKVDLGEYATSKHILQGIDVYCEKYNIVGKIDLFDSKTGMLTERKNLIKHIFDGYVFQLYAQYFSLEEMGFDVKSMRLYSYTDNKTYPVDLPLDSPEMFQKFIDTVNQISNTNIDSYVPTDVNKCKNCIYYNFCDRGLE